jgi:transcriptional regulator with XRE-family HTH domain
MQTKDRMTGDAERIKTLRERIGKSTDEVASLVGLGDMAYFDLESYDDELRTVLSLAQVKQLAAALGVATAALFADKATPIDRSIPYDELVGLVQSRLGSGVSREAFEEEVGWDLGALLDSEAATLSGYCVEFLEELCPRIGIDWIAALP